MPFKILDTQLKSNVAISQNWGSHAEFMAIQWRNGEVSKFDG